SSREQAQHYHLWLRIRIRKPERKPSGWNRRVARITHSRSAADIQNKPADFSRTTRESPVRAPQCPGQGGLDDVWWIICTARPPADFPVSGSELPMDEMDCQPDNDWRIQQRKSRLQRPNRPVHNRIRQTPQFNQNAESAA